MKRSLRDFTQPNRSVYKSSKATLRFRPEKIVIVFLFLNKTTNSKLSMIVIFASSSTLMLLCITSLLSSLFPSYIFIFIYFFRLGFRLCLWCFSSDDMEESWSHFGINSRKKCVLHVMTLCHWDEPESVFGALNCRVCYKHINCSTKNRQRNEMKIKVELKSKQKQDMSESGWSHRCISIIGRIWNLRYLRYLSLSFLFTLESFSSDKTHNMSRNTAAKKKWSAAVCFSSEKTIKFTAKTIFEIRK